MQQVTMSQEFWDVFGWYMLGVGLRFIYRVLRWVQTAIEARELTFVQVLASSGMAVIVSIGLAFIWTQGLLFVWIQQLGLDLPPFAITPLSSIAVGFFLKWAIGERLLGWFKREPKGRLPK